MKTLRSLLFTAALFALSTSGPAAADQRTLSLAPETTGITFDLEATGHDVHGTLYLENARISFDPETGEASGAVTINAKRTDTGSASRDKKMHKAVLESDSHPLIRFTPQALEGDFLDAGESQVTLRGTVALLGVEHPLELPSRVEISGDSAHFESTFEVPYVAWGLKNPSLLVLRVAKTVTVSITADGTISRGDDSGVAGN